MAAITDPILLDSTGQEIVEALETIAENMGTSAGHTIQNDSGTDMQRRDKLQFKGVYVEDDQTNDVTKVDICRTMTKAQMEALSGEELKGFINTSDEPDSLPLTAEWVAYDSNTSVKEKIDAIINKNETLAIPNIGQHKSVKITLADSDTFCIATFAGASGGAKNAMYLITASASVTIFQNDYSITKNSDRVFTVTSTDYWTRALLQIFAPNPNAVSYEILN